MMHSLGIGITAVQGHPAQLCIAEETVWLDSGGVLVAVWADEPSMASDIRALHQRLDISVRLVSGPLIADLCLEDNLTLEAALYDGSLPQDLITEIDILFGSAGCPVAWAAWGSVFPDTAMADAVMQARVGRALMADPDVLIIDAAQWDDTLLDAKRFSQSFAKQYPWRTLVWATHETYRAVALRAGLQEFQT